QDVHEAPPLLDSVKQEGLGYQSFSFNHSSF
ncbi:hypothetical protein CP02DC22_0214B, partial [Chlamydia psittaci 02DC22]